MPHVLSAPFDLNLLYFTHIYEGKEAKKKRALLSFCFTSVLLIFMSVKQTQNGVIQKKSILFAIFSRFSKF